MSRKEINSMFSESNLSWQNRQDNERNATILISGESVPIEKRNLLPYVTTVRRITAEGTDYMCTLYTETSEAWLYRSNIIAYKTRTENDITGIYGQVYFVTIKKSDYSVSSGSKYIKVAEAGNNIAIENNVISATGGSKTIIRINASSLDNTYYFEEGEKEALESMLNGSNVIGIIEYTEMNDEEVTKEYYETACSISLVEDTLSAENRYTLYGNTFKATWLSTDDNCVVS